MPGRIFQMTLLHRPGCKEVAKTSFSGSRELSSTKLLFPSTRGTRLSYSILTPGPRTVPVRSAWPGQGGPEHPGVFAPASCFEPGRFAIRRGAVPRCARNALEGTLGLDNSQGARE